MNAYRVHMSSGGNHYVETATINLGSRRTFYAWCNITMIDSLTDFDRDNAVAIDIYQVDGVQTGWRVSGGDHWGPSGAASNVLQGAMVGTGQRITFRIRSKHMSDLHCIGVGILLVP